MFGKYTGDEKYTRIPLDCERCRMEHGISPFQYGPDPNANCGKCIADATFSKLRTEGLGGGEIK